MSVQQRQCFLCSCNGSVPVDAVRLQQALALNEKPAVHSLLCHQELSMLTERAAGDVMITCTQEERLFGEALEAAGKTQSIRFFNWREAAGWSQDARKDDKAVFPKQAALMAMHLQPAPAPSPVVTYRSGGQLLITGPLDAALYWAQMLKDILSVTVLATGPTRGAELPVAREFPIYSGTLDRVDGWLGGFSVAWTQSNPIDLDVCVRCNACVEVCPENAIDASFQIDMARCKNHRQCVVACKAVGAIDFARNESAKARQEPFDLVLDLSRTPYFKMHQPPQGYFAPGADAMAQAQAALSLTGMTGTFDKPKYFSYKRSICAHSRSQKSGCSQCIDVCSTEAIRADGDGVYVEPFLCMGCGTCATVCPSGAMTYAYPTASELGASLRVALQVYQRAGGRDACLLLHASDAREVLARLARQGKGLPARVIPVEVQHVGSVGLDLWWSALAWGASQVAVLTTEKVAPGYLEALTAQMKLGDTIVQAQGFTGEHFKLIDGDDAEALEAALWNWAPAVTLKTPATFAATVDKRTTEYLALDDLHAGAPAPKKVMSLPLGAPFGAVTINPDTCTTCMSCVGACPENALQEGQDVPQVRFVERKCIQCGICEKVCPENAITLTPQLDLSETARQMRVLHEAKIFACVQCGKPLGTEKMVQGMLSRLSGHSMFAQPEALERLKMCADCRVVDLIKNEKSVDIRDIKS